MQVILLWNIILSICMLRTNGLPQDDASSNDEGNLKDTQDSNSIDGQGESSDSRQSAADNKQRDQNFRDSKKGSQINTGSQISKPDKDKSEPGFDLTENEIEKFKMWPRGLIPYYIDIISFSDKPLRDKIRSVLSSVNTLTRLNFVELPSPPIEAEARWVFFVNRRGLLGCNDHSVKNFTNTGVQKVVLGYDCLSTEGEMAEAVLAIAGVPAQHNAPNRDKFIKINYENIMPAKKYLFEKLKDNEWLFHNLKYDFNSASHYHSYKYSINGRATIERRKKFGNPGIRGSTGLTSYDILKIRMLYNFVVRKEMLQIEECYKMFVPGTQFKEYKPTSENKPRPKPNKYLGKEDDDAFDQEDEISKDKNKDSDQQDTTENTVNEERGDGKRNHVFNVEQRSKKKIYFSKNHKLSELSDYHSDKAK